MQGLLPSGHPIRVSLWWSCFVMEQVPGQSPLTQVESENSLWNSPKLNHLQWMQKCVVFFICRYMATGGIDRTLKVWDLRTFKALYSYKVASGPGSLAFSQRGLLAAGIGNIVEVGQLPVMWTLLERGKLLWAVFICRFIKEQLSRRSLRRIWLMNSLPLLPICSSVLLRMFLEWGMVRASLVCSSQVKNLMHHKLFPEWCKQQIIYCYS